VDQAPENSKTVDTTDTVVDTLADHRPTQQEKIPFWRIMLSVIQASIGVQNSKNRERDFSQGKLLPFIVAAVLFTAFFVLAVMLVVNLVLSS